MPVLTLVRRQDDHIHKRRHKPLGGLFATFGAPHVYMTDNGPPFNSHTFTEFAERLVLVHRKTTPLWPRANGAVESVMKKLVRVIKVAKRQASINNKLCASTETRRTRLRKSRHPTSRTKWRTTAYVVTHINGTSHGARPDHVCTRNSSLFKLLVEQRDNACDNEPNNCSNDGGEEKGRAPAFSPNAAHNATKTPKQPAVTETIKRRVGRLTKAETLERASDQQSVSSTLHARASWPNS